MPFPENNFNNIMFDIVPIMIFIIFILVIGLFIFNAARGVKQWNYNNGQPVLTVSAEAIGKRTEVTTHSHHDDGGIDHHHTSTNYYITFQVESGDRIEFRVKDQDYGMIIEGDIGKLTFQGTRFLGFKRQVEV